MYRRRVGEGEVVYLSLGHCNRRHDRMPNREELLPDRRGPWGLPVFQELVRRGVSWAARR
jgi:type 1 glutamine amidotransferase